MASNNKKQRQKLKRKAKKQMARRRDSISPVARLADAPGTCECWTSGDFGERGQMQIFAYKSAGGVSGIACFLIDRGVVGLKDCFVRLRIDRAEVDEMIEAGAQHGIPMSRCTLEEARLWIAGGARWAHINGMRLPKDWLKTASIMGGVGEWTKADVSDFELEYAGHPDDLRQRLIGEPFDEFVQRNDIHFIFSDKASYIARVTGDDDDDDEDEGGDDENDLLSDMTFAQMDAAASQFLPAATALASSTTTWLAARDEKGSSQLSKAWSSLMLAQVLAKKSPPDASENERADRTFELMDALSKRIPRGEIADYDNAFDQILKHLLTDNQMIKNAVLKHRLAPPSEAAR